jgi:hypothetical protein
VPGPSNIPAELLTGPFRLSDALRLGVSRQVLRGSRFRRVFRGAYVAADVPDSLAVRVDAARLLLPDSAVFSHQTAAALRLLPVPAHTPVEATVPPGLPRCRVRGLVVHHGLLERDVTLVDGLRVIRPERNFVELAGRLSLVDLVILGDATIRRGWTTAAALRQTASACRMSGTRLAREAAALVRPRVDSPMETRTRLLFVFAGLPCPEPGREVLDEYGQWVATPDLQYRAQRIAIEYDGDLHRTKKRKWRHDVATREQLTDLGWKIIVITADDVFVRPEALLQRVHHELVKRRHPQAPSVLDPAWRQHFVVRRWWSEEW